MPTCTAHAALLVSSLGLLPLLSAGVAACGESHAATVDGADAAPDVVKAAVPDAGVGVDPSMGPATWCDRNGAHDFCADFDTDDPLHGFDDITLGDDKAHVDLHELVASDRSAPFALHESGATLPTPATGQNPAGPFAGTSFSKSFGQTKSTKATVAFDLRVDANEESLTFLVELEGRTADEVKIVFNASLGLTPSSSMLSAVSVGQVASFAPIAMGRWVHVTIALDDHGTGKGTATLSYDGVAVGSTQLDGRLADAAGTRFFLGVMRTAPAGAYDVSFDNVTVDLH